MIFLSLLFCLIIHFEKTEFSKATITYTNQRTYQIKFPYTSKEDVPPGEYMFKFTIANNFLFSNSISLTADDCIDYIKINQFLLPISRNFFSKCDATQEINLNLSPYKKKGQDYQIEIKINNVQGKVGLKAEYHAHYLRYFLFIVLIACILLLRLSLIAKAIQKKANFFLRKNINEITVFLTGSVFTSILILFPSVIKTQNYYRIILSFSLVLTIALPLAISIFKNLVFGKINSIIFLFAILIYTLGLTKIFYDEHTYDIEGHLSYISFISENGYSPPSSGGWMFYHPSFYYRSAALFTEIMGNSMSDNYDMYLKTLQAFSLLLFTSYCYFALKSYDLLMKKLVRMKTNGVWVSNFVTVCVFLFWPNNAVTSVRIGNDIMVNFLHSISFYFMLKWWYYPKERYFVSSIFFVSLAVWAKTNGLLLLAIISALLILHFFIAYKNKAIKVNYARYTTFLFFSAFCILYLSFYKKIEISNGKAKEELIVGNAHGLGDELRIKNKIGNFSPFNPLDFVKIPYTSALDDTNGRQNFWFYLSKTALYGEFQEKRPLLQSTAQSLSVIFLLLIPFGIWGMIKSLQKFKLFLPFLLCFFTLLLSMVAFRFAYPFSCSNDFRYIYPALIPASLLLGFGCFSLKDSKILYILSILCPIAFVINSIIYYALIVQII